MPAVAGAGGLAIPEAERRMWQYGPNNAAEVHRPPAWRRFLGRFANPLIPVLLTASALSAVAGNLASFAIIVTIIRRSSPAARRRRTSPTTRRVAATAVR